MIVRVLSCGANWWAMHSTQTEDPLRFRRTTACFNTTALMYGRRRRDCHIYPGVIRFNRTSGFDPEFVDRIGGKTFRVSGPNLHQGRITLLFQFPATGQEPEGFLVTLRRELHGRMDFRDKHWRSSGLQPIAVSRFGERYEAMVLMKRGHWIETERGRWVISQATHTLALEEGNTNDAL